MGPEAVSDLPDILREMIRTATWQQWLGVGAWTFAVALVVWGIWWVCRNRE